MDKLLLLYADLRQKCQRENKRTKEVLSHSGHNTRSPWHLAYSPYQWGKQTFVGSIPQTFTDRPSSCGTTSRFLQKTLEKCGQHRLLCRLSGGLTRKKCFSEKTTSNVMLVSMRHSQVIETSYTSVGAKYTPPGKVPGPRSTGGRQGERERRKEHDPNQGSFQEHLLSTRRYGQWSRQGREQNTAAEPCPSQSTPAQCPDRPGARQCPDRPGAKQCPDRPIARQCPDRPIARQCPDRPGAKQCPDRPIARQCPDRPIARQCPDRPGAKQCPDRPIARQCPDRPIARQCPDRPRAKQCPDRPIARECPDRLRATQNPDRPGDRQSPDRPGARQNPDRPGARQNPDRPGARQSPDRPGAKQCPDKPGAKHSPDRPRQLMKYVHSTVFVQKHRPRHNLMYFLGKMLA